MDDTEMVEFLGLHNEPKGLAIVQALSPQKRATYEAMGAFCAKLPLIEAGLQPKPVNVFLDYPRKRNKLWPTK